jgi:hypothetical protein
MKSSEQVTPISETLALLAILAISAKDEIEGRVQPIDEAFAEIRESMMTKGPDPV